MPDEAFDNFPRRGTAEVHLATAFQNMIYDSTFFPAPLREKIYDYIRRDLAGEKGAKDTDEQFIYKTRKKGFGPFKKDMWNLPPNVLKGIGKELENKFLFIFDKLSVFKTRSVTAKFVKPVDVPVRDLKAVFFEKDYTGNPAYQEKKEFEPTRPVPGRKIKVVFKDSEVILGTTQGYQPGGPGFFIIPADPQSNNDRCFVLSAATQEVSFV